MFILNDKSFLDVPGVLILSYISRMTLCLWSVTIKENYTFGFELMKHDRGSIVDKQKLHTSFSDRITFGGGSGRELIELIVPFN